MEETDAPGTGVDEETQLRKRLFELDTAMDAIRTDPDAASELGVLAAERDAVMVRIRDLDPADAELGYQRNEEPFSKVQHDGRFIPSPSETGASGL
ncbi:MAG: hypothetical protein HKO63_02640 [Acidimicrobiia bacterium]|nr:hypothetical protein [Acidimicrobiia bacterium]MBT8191918.1 hypothetical protein [Acidimicrobiia bacterium]NNF87849.1 hypothetical protein [Acidimicrobiia bacterium]NNL12791.1 hypothetical protein [Acidimicrobiia bacterium]NNL97082.1 hypothetical protein [Acidimicrobiia bacterium]